MNSMQDLVEVWQQPHKWEKFHCWKSLWKIKRFFVNLFGIAEQEEKEVEGQGELQETGNLLDLPEAIIRGNKEENQGRGIETETSQGGKL